MNSRPSTAALPWIEVAREGPYFVTELEDNWTPIGQNDAITWPELAGAFRRRDMPGVEGYFRRLQQSGVTVLRLMLEYCHGAHRLLLTPYDTFWMWLHWAHHPYNQVHGGPCPERSQWLLSQEMRTAIKQRYAFAIERWGGSGAIFAWDLWNERHPAHAGNSTAPFADFITDVSDFVRATEMRLYGRSHLQTVSFFGPTLVENAQIADVVFRHGALDFASTHFYERNTIDCPRNTVDPAISTGKLISEALAQEATSATSLQHAAGHTFCTPLPPITTDMAVAVQRRSP